MPPCPRKEKENGKGGAIVDTCVNQMYLEKENEKGGAIVDDCVNQMYF